MCASAFAADGMLNEMVELVASIAGPPLGRRRPALEDLTAGDLYSQ